MAREKAEQLLKEITSGISMKQIASKEHLTVEETGLFKRESGLIGKIGFSKELAREAFSLSSQKSFPQKVYDIGGRYFVVELKGKEGISEEEFQSQKEKIRERFLSQKSEEKARLWLKRLKEEAEIKTLLTI